MICVGGTWVECDANLDELKEKELQVTQPEIAHSELFGTNEHYLPNFSRQASQSSGVSKSTNAR